MNNEFKKAAARLIFDLMGADGYISDRELEIMKSELNDRYDLTQVERVTQANGISFSGALEILQKCGDSHDIDRLLKDLYLIAGVGEQKNDNEAFTRLEGHCSLYEAWLLFTIEYALKKNAIVFSIQKKEYRFSRSEIIYIENDISNNEKYHAEIESRFNEFNTRLELYGMRFVYIPKVCHYLKEKRKQGKLISLMRYVSPYKRYEDEDAENIASNIDHISTADFVKDILPEREKSLFKDLKPSFLLKIKTTIVLQGKPMKVNDFIIIPINNSISETLDDAIKQYTRYTLDRHIPERKLHGCPFMLHGFDRTFLNFAMAHLLTTDRLTKITFDFSRVVDGKQYKKQVIFNFDGKRKVNVDFENKPMILYLIFIIYTLYKDGLPVQVEISSKKKNKAKHEQMFTALYKKVKGKDTKVKGKDPELYNSKGVLSSEITRLNAMLKEIPIEYWPKKDNIVFRVPYITKGMVFFKFRDEEFELCDKVRKLMEKHNTMDFEEALTNLFS